MDFTDNLKQYLQSKEQATLKKVSFLRQCLVLVVSLTGLLASLYDASNTSQPVRMAFSLTMVLFVACLIVLLRAVYILDVKFPYLLEEDYARKLRAAWLYFRPMKPVAAGDKKSFSKIEKTAYVLMVFAFLSLACFAILKTYL